MYLPNPSDRLEYEPDVRATVFPPAARPLACQAADYVSKKFCRKQKNDRADINATKIGHETAHTAEQRFVYPAQKTCCHTYERLPRIHNPKPHKPADNHIGKQRVDIQADDLVNQDDQCRHGRVFRGLLRAAPHYNGSMRQFNHIDLADWLAE